MGSVVFTIAGLVSVLAFIGCAWITRAGYWRSAAAIIGGLVGAALAFCVDMAAFEFGWWRYGSGENHAPVIAYAPVVFWFGAGLGLVGWRMMRVWEGAGEVAFFLIFVLFGLARDLTMNQSADVFAFGAGPLPIVISAVTWLAIAFVTQLFMQWLVGPVDADPLAPEHMPPLHEIDWPGETDLQSDGARFVIRE